MQVVSVRRLSIIIIIEEYKIQLDFRAKRSNWKETKIIPRRVAKWRIKIYLEIYIYVLLSIQHFRKTFALQAEELNWFLD